MGEIGQRYFWEFKSDMVVTYDDLFEISPYLSYLHLGSNQIVALPNLLPNLLRPKVGAELRSVQELYLGWNMMIVALPDLGPNIRFRTE